MAIDDRLILGQAALMLASTRRGQVRGTHEHLAILVPIRAPLHNDSQHETTSWITNIGPDTGGIQICGILEQQK